MLLVQKRAVYHRYHTALWKTLHKQRWPMAKQRPPRVLPKMGWGDRTNHSINTGLSWSLCKSTIQTRAHSMDVASCVWYMTGSVLGLSSMHAHWKIGHIVGFQPQILIHKVGIHVFVYTWLIKSGERSKAFSLDPCHFLKLKLSTEKNTEKCYKK